METLQDRLLAAARAAAANAYCPYSGFHVGAAVLVDGVIYTGANVENASYGLTVCAERIAIFKAITVGALRQLQAIAISCPEAAAGAPFTERMPCGACRQVIAEFAAPDLSIHVDGVGDFTLANLLPSPFVLRQTL